VDKIKPSDEVSDQQSKEHQLQCQPQVQQQISQLQHHTLNGYPLTMIARDNNCQSTLMNAGTHGHQVNYRLLLKSTNNLLRENSTMISSNICV